MIHTLYELTRKGWLKALSFYLINSNVCNHLAEKEAKEKAEKEAKLKAEKEAKAKAEKEAKAKAEAAAKAEQAKKNKALDDFLSGSNVGGGNSKGGNKNSDGSAGSGGTKGVGQGGADGSMYAGLVRKVLRPKFNYVGAKACRVKVNIAPDGQVLSYQKVSGDDDVCSLALSALAQTPKLPKPPENIYNMVKSSIIKFDANFGR